MPPATTIDNAQRSPLTADRVLTGGIELADRIGIEPFTIRKLAVELDVKPMTIYHHVASKEAIIDGMVDLVFSEIDVPPVDTDWKTSMRQRCVSVRAVLARHPWAPPLMESRTSPGPATLRHHEAVLGCLRRGGLSLGMTAHAYALIDSYLYGFALQEANLPFNGSEDIGDLAEAIVEAVPAEEYPNLTEFTAAHVLQPGYAFGNSFEFGLDLLLDGIQAAATPIDSRHVDTVKQ
jgi:AcrR family transcriptional regulator